MSTVSVTVDELKRIGIAFTVEQGKKHIKIKADGLPVIVCSVTCSDRLGEIKARSLVKRLIKQNGLGEAA